MVGLGGVWESASVDAVLTVALVGVGGTLCGTLLGGWLNRRHFDDCHLVQTIPEGCCIRGRRPNTSGPMRRPSSAETAGDTEISKMSFHSKTTSMTDGNCSASKIVT